MSIVQLAALGTGVLENLLHHISKEKLSIVLFLCACGCIAGLLFCESGVWSVVLFSILMGVETMYYALLNVYENDAIVELPRATTLSFFSLITNACSSVTSVAFGYASSLSLKSAYLLAIFFVIAGLVLFVKWGKNKEILVKSCVREIDIR